MWERYHHTEPSSNYKCDVVISNKYKTTRFSTIADGDCLFHSILNCYYRPYYKMNELEKRKYTRKLRAKLAEVLPRYYNSLLGGALVSNSLDDYKLETMIETLKSRSSIGYGYLAFVADILNKDIYIIDGHNKNKLYRSDENTFMIKGDRDSIVLYYKDHHYEPIGVVPAAPDTKVVTHFKSTHPFIEELRLQL